MSNSSPAAARQADHVIDVAVPVEGSPNRLSQLQVAGESAGTHIQVEPRNAVGRRSPDTRTLALRIVEDIVIQGKRRQFLAFV